MLNRWKGGVLIAASILLPATGLTANRIVEETFGDDPTQRGWRTFGESGLFGWDSEAGRLAVTWDSSRSNSYFHLPLGTVLTPGDDFALQFEMQLDDIAIGVTEGKPFTFQIAVGMMKLEDATRPEFYRGSGISRDHGPRNAVEFDYFPDSGFGATFAPTVISSSNRIVFSDNHPLEMTTGDRFRIRMSYAAEDRILRTEVTRNGAPYGLGGENAIADLNLEGFPAFEVDTVAVMSYSDEGQVPASLSGSVLAHGWVDDLRLTLPRLPVSSLEGRFAGSVWQVEFQSNAGWVYRLQRTTGFSGWEAVAESEGDGGALVLEDPDPPAEGAFYRVEASAL